MIYDFKIDDIFQNPIYFQRYQKKGIFQFWGQIHVQGQKLCWIDASTNWCPICQNFPKICNFQVISRVPENFWKFPGMMEFLNSMLKIKFLDKRWVGKIPHMLKAAKTSQFQGYSRILESWIPGTRNHNIFSKVRKNNTNMLGKLFFLFYQKPPKNAFFWKVAYFLGKRQSQ